jgi:heme-degrading monooxygenase HmoA
VFVVVHRWRCPPENEPTFREAWSTMTRIIREQCGSLGSRLHRADDGTLVAYAQWPSRQQWEAANASGPAAEAARAVMQRCAERAAPPLVLDVLDDLLVATTT